MGGDIWHVIFKVLLPEALPALLAGITLTLVMLIGFSSMAGVIGGGGLGTWRFAMAISVSTTK